VGDSAPNPETSHNVRVLYVGGMPRSGSTLIDLLMHRLPGHVAVGELFYLWRNGVQHDGLCACSRPFLSCPFWSAVGERAFGGWSAADAKRVLPVQEAVDRTSWIPFLLAPRRPAAFQESLSHYTDALRRLYRAIATVSGASVIVDSSKRPSLAYVLRQMPDIDLRVVQVVRDPRGVAFSFAKHVDLPPGADVAEQMPRSTVRKVSRRWVTVNALIAGIERFDVPTLRVRYEDLVADPRHELARVLAFEGLAEGPETLDFIVDHSFSVPQTHVIAAGRIRLRSGVMPLSLDEDWRRRMPRRAKALVDTMTLPTRWRYGYR
jgi:hypothetical protein